MFPAVVQNSLGAEHMFGIVQILSLLQSYDVAWPKKTTNAFSFADALNVGVSLTAPECFWGPSFRFYHYYVMQMILPVSVDHQHESLELRSLSASQAILQPLPKRDQFDVQSWPHGAVEAHEDISMTSKPFLAGADCPSMFDGCHSSARQSSS